MLVPQEIHCDVFNVAPESFKERKREDDVFHVGLLGRNLREVKKVFSAFHLLKKIL
jgi:hypothetical protein